MRILILTILLTGLIPSMSAPTGPELKIPERCKNDPLPGISFVSRNDSLIFDSTIRTLADEIGSRPDYIMATIMMESGFVVDARNRDTNAYGLIQFMPKTLEILGAPGTMDTRTQLYYVRQYFLLIAKTFGKLHTLEDTYCAVFYPSAIGKPLAYRIGGSKVYALNRGLDYDRDGVLTKRDIKQKLSSTLTQL